jgi:hypothetical protein
LFKEKKPLVIVIFVDLLGTPLNN